MRARWLLALALACACKDQSAAPAPAPALRPATTTPQAPQQSPADAALAERPALANAPVPTPPLGELSIEDAAKIIPKLEAKEILPLRQTSDRRQVHATWCLDGDSADEVARRVGHTLAESGFADLGIRGDARKAGVQGDKDGLRLSMIVSGSTAANCPAPQHYFASATVFRFR